jgi:hypothetical protein
MCNGVAWGDHPNLPSCRKAARVWFGGLTGSNGPINNVHRHGLSTCGHHRSGHHAGCSRPGRADNHAPFPVHAAASSTLNTAKATEENCLMPCAI